MYEQNTNLKTILQIIRIQQHLPTHTHTHTQTHQPLNEIQKHKIPSKTMHLEQEKYKQTPHKQMSDEN